MKVSQLYGKRIESADKKTHGVILAVSCAGNTVEGYICFDEQENEFFASAAGSRNLKDKVTFLHCGAEGKNAYRLRLGLPVYSHGGKFLGNLSDCTVKGGRLFSVTCKAKKYPVSRISISDAVILDTETKALKAAPQSVPRDGEAELAAKDMFIQAICGG